MTTSGSDMSVESVVRRVVAGHRDQRGPLLPVLHAVQAELGHVPQEAIPVLADELNLSRADVHGVVTFYHDFRREPAGRHIVRICRAEACQALGADRLVSYARESGLTPGETSADGSVTVEQVFCLGNCALGPAVEANGRLYGRVSPARLGSLLRGTPGETRNNTLDGTVSS
ncbi:formate dehydrogenase subunit gamma [Streptomyces sp. WI04-05B]|uniref:formate dehydrogenase subunit gamma n=1 Tax=Streptomyces TaxID=1883 RepID=UPI0029A93F3A|nr:MULTISPECIES: formate dehydrogenase subunit gamma [unclassified Streptomyces]MDX2548260.1 formate dehydrogenase subunit gamma [Streptomyces sp. WI04-05B]MDX2586636.1 formate dehydrogenase subunit gamma [Streptomyces sp. WI04-05A]MDX3746266.1 formate dehydrogenase subunit gamma [Streptomyces sp. AK08-02]